jgi:hypothetical protein
MAPHSIKVEPVAEEGGAEKQTAANSQQQPPPPQTPRGEKSRSRKPSKKRNIKFKGMVAVNIIPNLDTYTPDECAAVWFAADEYGGMEDECDLTSEFLEHNKPLWPGYCGRGLEAWTTAGEQSKERHVQLAVDIVWQGQLEQWKAAKDTNECWEFIRARYVQISKPCHRLAHKRGLADEHEVQSYLASVRSLDKNRRRMLGIHSKGKSGARVVHRSSSDNISSPKQTPKSVGRKKIGRTVSEKSPPSFKSSPFKSPSKTPRSSRPHLSGGSLPGGVLKAASCYVSSDTEQEEDESHRKTPRVRGDKGSSSSSSSSKNNTKKSSSDDASQGSSKNTRKIVFQAKSKARIPTSPVASLCSESDSTSTARRMRSHMSVASEDSTRRRMLRTATIKQL